MNLSGRSLIHVARGPESLQYEKQMDGEKYWKTYCFSHEGDIATQVNIGTH